VSAGRGRQVRKVVGASVGGFVLAIVLLAVMAIVAIRLVQPSSRSASVAISTAEVERDARAAAHRRGQVIATHCKQISRDTWQCSVALKSGAKIAELATWHTKNKGLGIRVVKN